MIELDRPPAAQAILARIERLWSASAAKIRALERDPDPGGGAPVHTVRGRYRARGWTDWTEGFRVGSALLQFDATGDSAFLELGRRQTLERMAAHVTHFGVHDHGFTNVSTYGNLLRLVTEGKVKRQAWERAFYRMALRCSGAVQASRWTALQDGEGFIYSFNGPHSLFADTIRSLRSLALAHRLGGTLTLDQDLRVSLLERLVKHARTTARYTVYYGEGRDGYDVRGRVAHESLFNVRSGTYRCAATQQGYSPFGTWTRGLAWIMCGYAELLEYFAAMEEAAAAPFGGRGALLELCAQPLRATCDFYLAQTPTCGVPYWDTAAPRLGELGDYLERPADPFNSSEPVDSSAAAIAAQGLLRFGRYLGKEASGKRYWNAGLRIAGTLFEDPYLSTDAEHQGLLLHSVYHWPNRWDYVPAGRSVACGEATMWGDYHARELALYLQRVLRGETCLAFFNAA